MTLGLTLFTTCKPLVGLAALTQRNALLSWQRLCPPCEVLVFGDEAGIGALCAELRFRHFPDIARNDLGTPLINSLFAQAEAHARNDCLVYVNADILLSREVLTAAQQVRDSFDKFLLIARRWNVDVDSEWNFLTADWDGELRRYAAAHGVLDPPDGGTDVFVYRRGALGHLPPLAVGRSRCDSMLILQARRRALPVIDATEVLTALHQNHDYSHVTDSSTDRPKGVESEINARLLGDVEYLFTARDATHRLTRSGVDINREQERRLPRG